VHVSKITIQQSNDFFDICRPIGEASLILVGGVSSFCEKNGRRPPQYGSPLFMVRLEGLELHIYQLYGVKP
jgi:hypothetical protein